MSSVASAEVREFHLGDILSVTTGRLVALNHMSAIHELLDFMTGDSPFTHQLPRASDECRPALLRQHPALSDVVVPEEFAGKEHIDRWLADQVATYGENLSVRPLDPGEHQHIDALTELFGMVGEDQKVVVVEVGAPEVDATAVEEGADR